MENDLISRSAAKEEILSWAVVINKPHLLSKDDTLHVLDTLPAVDAVEVVRCEDCEAWNTKAAMSFLRNGVYVRCCPCGVYGRLMYDNDFCSKGKRRGE